MKKPVLVVMAAGMGSRYGGLKQIDPVGPSGEAILDYSLYDARRAGFKTVVFIIKHEIEQAFKEAVGARAVRAGFEVRYAYQQLEKLPEGFTVPEGRVKPWGTAHAILVAEEAIGDAPFAVINADDYYGPQGFKLIYDYLSTHADGDRYAWAMVGFLLGNTVSANGSVSRGVCVTDESRNLVSVTERTCIEPYADGIHYSEDGGKSWADLPADCVVSMNLWGFTPAYVQEAKAGFAAFLQASLPVNPMKCEYYLPTVVTNALEAGKADVHVLTSADKWHGITYREDKPELVEAKSQLMSPYIGAGDAPDAVRRLLTTDGGEIQWAVGGFVQPFLDSFDTPLLYGMTEYVGRSYSERSTNYGYGGRTSTNVVIKPKKSKDSMIVPASGHVLLAEDLGGSYGYTVVIDHGAGLRSIFYGLTALDVEAGDDVKQGQLLGTSGRTVVAELRIGTVPINPLLVWRGQCDGLKYY